RAEAEILRCPAHVEGDGGLALACVAAVDDSQRVFHCESAQMWRHRWTDEHLPIEELIGVGRLHFHFAQWLALHPLGAERGHARIDLTRLRTGEAKLLGDPAEVDDLDDDRRVATLLKARLGRTTSHLDTPLGLPFPDEAPLVIHH